MILPPPKPPRDPFALEVVAQLPLAESFYLVWSYLASDTVLQDLFDRHRGKCYQERLTFCELVWVLADALTRYHGSGNRAIAFAIEGNQLSVQARATYGKLARLPLPLAEAFLSVL